MFAGLTTTSSHCWAARRVLCSTTARHQRASVSTSAATARVKQQQQHQQSAAATFVGLGLAAFLWQSNHSNEYPYSSSSNNNNSILAISTTHCHCQVPCGIFDDPAIVAQLLQAAATIRKAMTQSAALNQEQQEAETPSIPPLQAMNQVIRWVVVKEEHCQEIIDKIANYCLCQRVKPGLFASQAEYREALQVHHAAMQAAMKAKQSMDLAACDELERALQNLAKMYVKE